MDILPPEILLRIIKCVSYRDMAVLRSVSRTLCTFCDLPENWRSIELGPSEQSDTTKELWKLIELKKLIQPHAAHIRSIHIWGVRDTIVHYLLTSIPNLEHLTICGWTTLSDHCLRLIPSQSLKLKSLELIASSQQSNFVSVDAYTLGNLLLQSPQMTNLVIGCDIHIHADTFVAELEKRTQDVSCSDLQSFILGTRRTWLNDHVLRLVSIYPSIQEICLMSKATAGYDTKKGSIDDWMWKKLQEIMATEPLRFDDTAPLLSSDEMIVYLKKPTSTLCV